NFLAITGTRLVSDGVFHHVAYVRTQTNLSFYVDGSLDVTATTPGVANISNTVNLVAGHSVCVGADGTTYFSGQLDEIALYQRALTTNEIQAIYNARGAGKCVFTNPPSITSQPVNQTVTVGQNATFTVGASGTQPLSYQWFLNGTNAVSGGTAATLTL